MPIYEYECRECNTRFEKLQSINEDEKNIKCPICKADKPKRALSLFSTGSKSGPDLCSTGSTWGVWGG